MSKMQVKYSPVIFSSILVLLAFGQVLLSPEQSPPSGTEEFRELHKSKLQAGQEIVFELNQRPGDRYVLMLETDGLSDVYIISGKYTLSTDPPPSATSFYALKKLTYAIPSQTGGTYYVLIRQREGGEVRLSVKEGTIDDATRALRAGGEITRNSFVAVFPPDSVFTFPIYQFIPGTRLHLETDGGATVALVDSAGYYAFSKGSKQLEDLCKASNCLQGAGSLALESEDYIDLYLIVENKDSPTTISLQVIATPKMLFYVGTCS